jgi:cell division septation protein DedD
MPTATQDTEITLGTGRMLAIFFSFVLVCAFFFAIGFSLGRKTAMAGVGISQSPPIGTPSTVVRPSPQKNGAAQAATPQSGDFSFYKAVGAKNADAALTPADAKTPPASQPSSAPADANANAPTDPTATPAAAGYFVQVAAVTRQEDADSLVEALKKKQYPAFTVNNNGSDKFYRVQIGPYADLKDAEAMRARLITDGYTPIVKK